LIEIFLDTATLKRSRVNELKKTPMRIWRHFDPAEEKRVCRICGIEKPIQEFEKTSPYKGRVYRRRICKQCRKPSVRILEKRWNEAHRDRRLEIWRNNNMRRILRNKGIPEKEFYKTIEGEFKGAYPLHNIHPDYYCSGKFIEIKRASTKKQYMWNKTSIHFPNLYFRYERKSLDEQIALYPKPLLVIIFDKDNGKELCRREFS
jgi:hypothetical protein